MLKQNQYRCTREVPYHSGSAGYRDLSARQGYYIDADNEQEAYEEMRKLFPRESLFTVHLWKI